MPRIASALINRGSLRPLPEDEGVATQHGYKFSVTPKEAVEEVPSVDLEHATGDAPGLQRKPEWATDAMMQDFAAHILRLGEAQAVASVSDFSSALFFTDEQTQGRDQASRSAFIIGPGTPYQTKDFSELSARMGAVCLHKLPHWGSAPLKRGTWEIPVIGAKPVKYTSKRSRTLEGSGPKRR